MTGQFLLMDNVDLEAVHAVHNVAVREADYVILKCQCFIY